MDQIIIAIDPGFSGGFAWQYQKGTFVKNMPETLADIRDLIMEIRKLGGVHVVMERTGGFWSGGQKMRCGCGREINAAPRSGPAMATFSRHCGQLEGLLVGMQIPYDAVAPAVWMKAFIGASIKDKHERKNTIKAKAQQLHPDLKITLKTADAVGILEWYLHLRGVVKVENPSLPF